MPQRLDRNEAIALARQGKGAWNAWAAENQGATVNFSGANLTGISFAGFEFPGRANFDGINISGPADFHEATFFGDATFLGGSFFHKAKFSRAASFRESKFSGQSDSTDHASFSGVEFSDYGDFTGAKFSMWAHFEGSEFSGQASFRETIFLNMADFSGGKFSRGAYFNNAYFERGVDFSDCNFDGKIDFRVKSFSEPPRFHGTSVRQGAEFGNIDDFFADFVRNGDEKSYRALKLSMGQQQARTEESAFAALELKARRYRLKSEAKKMKLGRQRFLSWTERCGYCLWEKCSNSGRGFLRPFLLYIASGCAFTAFYVLLCQIWFGDWWTSLRHGIRYSFLKQFPFAAAFRGGSDRIGELETKLFGANLPPGWVDLLNAAQSITALILIFLMGLGIRHKFRLR